MFFNSYAQYRDVQIDVLQRQVLTAVKLNKPLVIHARDAEHEIGEVLEKVIPTVHLSGILLVWHITYTCGILYTCGWVIFDVSHVTFTQRITGILLESLFSFFVICRPEFKGKARSLLMALTVASKLCICEDTHCCTQTGFVTAKGTCASTN